LDGRELTEKRDKNVTSERLGEQMEAPSEPTQTHACARFDRNTARELLDEIEPSSLCQSSGRKRDRIVFATGLF